MSISLTNPDSHNLCLTRRLRGDFLGLLIFSWSAGRHALSSTPSATVYVLLLCFAFSNSQFPQTKPVTTSMPSATGYVLVLSFLQLMISADEVRHQFLVCNDHKIDLFPPSLCFYFYVYLCLICSFNMESLPNFLTSNVITVSSFH